MITKRDEDFERQKAEDIRRNKKWNQKERKLEDCKYTLEEKVDSASKLSDVIVKQNQKQHQNILKIVDGVNSLLKKFDLPTIEFDKPEKREERTQTDSTTYVEKSDTIIKNDSNTE